MKPNAVPKTEAPTTLLIAEDDSGYRKSLKQFLEVDGSIQVVGEAKNGMMAVSLASTLCPQVTLMDISMPLLNGLEACRQITAANPSAHVLILSANGDEAYVQEAINCGACGYLVKSKATSCLHKAIAATKLGKPYFGKLLPKYSS